MRSNGVQRSGDARSDCLIGCPLPNPVIEQWHTVAIVTGYTLFVTGYTLFVTSQYDVIFSKFFDTTCIFRDAGSTVGQGEQ